MTQQEKAAREIQYESEDKARQALGDVLVSAKKARKETVNQADLVCKEAKMNATDKQAKKEADRIHKETIEEAKKVEAALTKGAMEDFAKVQAKAAVKYNETKG
ncbi:hypothetical protein ES703_121406 [subsurface metagenome]